MVNPTGPCKCSLLTIPGLLAVCLLASELAMAEPLTLSGGLNNRFSDNIEQVSGNETSDAETRVNVRVSHQSDPGQCQSGTYADIGYGVWHQSTYDPETYTTLDFQGDCEVAHGLTWELADNIRDVRQDSRGTDTPDNTTRKNLFRTGPVYVIAFSKVDQLRLSAQYENTKFSEPDETDSERYVGSAGWNHMFSVSFAGGLSATTSQTEFDTGAEIDTDQISFNFSQTWPTTLLSGSLGLSEIESRFAGNTQSSDGLVGNISFEREINPFTTYYLDASREFTEQTSDFDIRFDEFVFDLRETSGVEVTAVDTGIRRRFSDASQLNINIFANRSDYLGTGERESGLGLVTGYRRPVLPLLTLQTNVRYEYQTFDEDNVDEKTISLDVGLTYQLTRDLGITGRVGHTSKTSDLSTSEYDENWLAVGLDYRFF